DVLCHHTIQKSIHLHRRKPEVPFASSGPPPRQIEHEESKGLTVCQKVKVHKRWNRETPRTPSRLPMPLKITCKIISAATTARKRWNGMPLRLPFFAHICKRNET